MENRFKKLREEKIVKGKPMKKSDLRRELEKMGYKIDRNKMDRIETDLPNQEKHAQPPDAEVLKAYSKYFNVTTDYLLGLRDYAPVGENMAMISKTTGLNYDAIQTLKRLKHDHSLKMTLNFIMSDADLFCEFINHIKIFFNCDNYNTPIHWDSQKEDYVESERNPAIKNEILFVGKKDSETHKILDHLHLPHSDLEYLCIAAIQRNLKSWKAGLKEGK